MFVGVDVMTFLTAWSLLWLAALGLFLIWGYYINTGRLQR